MRRLVPALALAAVFLAAACSKSPCQELGEKLCRCTGLTGDSCRTQVEDQIKSADPAESTCEAFLRSCNAPNGGDLCEWLLTEDGKKGCGLAQ
jgi:hypothetical protein